MFKLMGKEINAVLGAQTILIWTFVWLQSGPYFHETCFFLKDNVMMLQSSKKVLRNQW